MKGKKFFLKRTKWWSINIGVKKTIYVQYKAGNVSICNVGGAFRVGKWDESRQQLLKYSELWSEESGQYRYRRGTPAPEELTWGTGVTQLAIQ